MISDDQKAATGTKMKTFVNPMIPVEGLDADDKVWMSCIRSAQIFLLCLSFTVIHHITNPFSLPNDVITVLTAALCAVECAFLVIICAFFCIRPREKGTSSMPVEDPHSTTNFHIHPMYFI